MQFFNTSQKRKMFGVKVVSIDVINHPLQYGGKKLGHPVYFDETFFYYNEFFAHMGYSVALTANRNKIVCLFFKNIF